MKRIRVFIFFLFILVLLVGCGSTKTNVTKEKKISIEDKVKQKMEKMTLEQKIAQMLVVYYTNDTVDDSLKETLKKYNLGGFILMKDNITTFDKTKKFVDDLQKNSDIPMIISIDQEGGKVQRLELLEDIKPTYIPSMYELGETNDKELAYQVGKVTAEELRTIGVNVVYAPVLDIYSNKDNEVIGTRSFGTTPEQVSDMAISYAKGLEENGVIATYKHFPGHGDTSTDSHYDLPVINKSYDELKNFELIPFKKAIENDAKIIMIGHLNITSIDNEPSSLSKKIITDVLYKDLGYKGLVITDALNMGAITNNYTDEEIYTKTINAGTDLLLMPNGSKKTIEYIKKNISEERINKSVEKILKFKYTYLTNYKTLDKSYLNSKEHQDIISKINVND